MEYAIASIEKDAAYLIPTFQQFVQRAREIAAHARLHVMIAGVLDIVHFDVKLIKVHRN